MTMDPLRYDTAPGGGTPLTEDLPPPEEAPSQKLPPGEWLRKNLFSNTGNSILTIVLGGISLYLIYRLALMVFVNMDWEIIRANLALMTVGQFPRDAIWRPAVSFIVGLGVLGLGSGLIAAVAGDKAREAGLEPTISSPLNLARRFWPFLFVIAVMLVFTSTITPLVVVTCALLALFALRYLGLYLPVSLRPWGWPVVVVLAIVSFRVQIATGTGMIDVDLTVHETTVRTVLAVLVALAALGVGVTRGRGSKETSGDVYGAVIIALGGVALAAAIYMGAVVFGAFAAIITSILLSRRWMNLVYLVAVVIALQVPLGDTGVKLDDLGGLTLNFYLTVLGITLAFPLGLLLALGRRSQLRAVRWISVGYIEFVRGVPMITWLLMASFFLGFFLPSGSETPSLFSRAVVVVAIFSAAYLAEITRGGLQAVPKGQVEAGQSVGLGAAAITRAIVLPQALRAVIPAIVGQFISLFKDTTLVSIIGMFDLMNSHTAANLQPEFRGKLLASVTLLFVGLIFWAGSYTMSRESRRLEQKLGVGEKR